MLKLTPKQKFEMLRSISGHFLCDVIRDEWKNMNQRERLDFISENLWAPYEDWPAQDVLDQINGIQNSIIETLEREWS